MTNALEPGPGAASAAPQRVCASADLVEGGTGRVWEVLQYGRPVRAFAVRYQGLPRAYLNRCAHVPTELDWQPGEFFDSDRSTILCSMHGAAYAPEDGRCIGGPCGRGRLTALDVREAGGEVTWYPSRDIRPLPEGDPPGSPIADESRS